MVEESGRRENQSNREPFFVEAEWDGETAFDITKLIRGDANEKQRITVEKHYSALRDLLADPDANQGKLWDGGMFASDDFADIRWRVINLPNLDFRIADRLAAMPLYADAKTQVTSLHPKITYLGGNLTVYGTGKLDAPALTKVGGDLHVSGTDKLDALTTVGGYLTVSGTGKLDAPALTKVGGDLTVYGTGKLDALTTVGGDLYVELGGVLHAPFLKKDK
jgi:hypothetical protein